MDKSRIKEEQKEFMNIMMRFGKLNMQKLTPNLSHAEFGTLKTIDCISKEKEPKVSDLVKMLKAPAPAVSRNLKNLENKGLIERTVDKGDRRNTLVRMTEKGKAEYEKTIGAFEDFADCVFGSMGEEAISKMNAIFTQLVEAAEVEIEKRTRNMKGENVDE